MIGYEEAMKRTDAVRIMDLAVEHLRSLGYRVQPAGVLYRVEKPGDSVVEMSGKGVYDLAVQYCGFSSEGEKK